MTEQEQFEEDYLAAFPEIGSKENIQYLANLGITKIPFTLWQQQAARHKAEIAELVELLAVCRRSINSVQQNRLAVLLSEAIAKYEGQS